MTRGFLPLVLLACMAAVPAAEAHGQPAINIAPDLVAAGGTVAVEGVNMPPSESFQLSLEGIRGSIPLGNATATGEGEEGGFRMQVVIPASVAPGSYALRATAEDGDHTDADITITLPSSEAGAGPATVREPSGDQHALERPRPVTDVAGVAALIAFSLVGGFLLARR